MGTTLVFWMERIGGRRRSVTGAGGGTLCVCAYLGPADGAVDLVAGEGPPAASIRGGTMPVRDYRARLAAGEGLRVFGGPERFTVESDRRAATEVLASCSPDGRRRFTWYMDGSVLGVLLQNPGDGGEPWRFEVSDREDPIRVLAVLHAAERLLREMEGDCEPNDRLTIS